MKFGKNTLRLAALSLVLTPMLAVAPTASAQRYDRHDNFYNGARRGGGGGYYDHGHDRGYYDQHHGGIGPGKGALIGGAGGAALGAVFGGGLSGALIGGAAGAGIGAIAGKVHQDNQRRDYHHYR